MAAGTPQSKLTSFPRPLALARDKVADIRFRRVAGKWLVTNDAGHFAQLDEGDFSSLIEGRLEKGSSLWTELQEKGFIRDHLDFQGLAQAYRAKNSFLFKGASLHIMVVTLRCNHKCVYCHASVVDPKRADFDMTVETARRTVDFIFQAPDPDIVIEFQGGEPLLNWPVVEFVVRYASKKNEAAKKNLFFALVSNFSLMDRNKLDFLVSNKVALCTSLDGPAEIHDANRVYLGGRSHEETARWIREIQDLYKDKVEEGRQLRFYKVGALFTATRLALGRPREVVDEYVRLGLDHIFLRPLSPVGFARRCWGTIGYEPEQFLAFYKEAFERILELNLEGRRMVEKWASLLVRKILRREDPGYVDLRSPAGAGLGVLGYNFDGDVFNGDEGRMLAQEGEPLFKLGNVATSSYNEVIEHPANRACAVSTTLEGQPLCSQCAYKPYCGVCPVLNYASQNSIWGHMPSNARCTVYMGIFDYLFEKLRDHKLRRIMESWLVNEWEVEEVLGEAK